MVYIFTMCFKFKIYYGILKLEVNELFLFYKYDRVDNLVFLVMNHPELQWYGYMCAMCQCLCKSDECIIQCMIAWPKIIFSGINIF